MIAPFVDIDWVEAHREEVVLADCRWYMDGRSGRAAYEDGHLPGAVFVDLDTALTRHADPAEEGRHPLADAGAASPPRWARSGSATTTPWSPTTTPAG